jgi:hypothetical protein
MRPIPGHAILPWTTMETGDAVPSGLGWKKEPSSHSAWLFDAAALAAVVAARLPRPLLNSALGAYCPGIAAGECCGRSGFLEVV